MIKKQKAWADLSVHERLKRDPNRVGLEVQLLGVGLARFAVKGPRRRTRAKS